jgi:hypothetical protein
VTVTYIAPVDIGPSDKPLQTGIVGDGSPVVTHDGLCPCASHLHTGDNDHLRSTCIYCRCDLIARVRCDERTRVVDGRPL